MITTLPLNSSPEPYTEISVSRQFFKASNKMLQDTDAAGTFFRLICSIGEGCEIAFGRKIGFTYIRNHVACANMLDASPARTLNSFFGKSDPDESPLSKLKGYTFGVVNLACIPLLLQDLKAVNLAQVAANIGSKARAFQFLGRISLITVVKSLLVVGNLFGAIDAINRIRADKFETTFEKRATYLELAAHVASIALHAFGLICATCPVAIIVLGVVAYGMGVVKALHKFGNEEAAEWKNAQLKPKDIVREKL